MSEILIGESLKVTEKMPVGGSSSLDTWKLALPHQEGHNQDYPILVDTYFTITGSETHPSGVLEERRGGTAHWRH